ncbi:HD domain-containing protein [Dactylosporangium sp. NPDC051541]|uniref:HD domain-containing protein n=1 Tax=Dactylosporangium sp. NPDC051541 TaxID=3363977 RepID=UPI00378F1519
MDFPSYLGTMPMHAITEIYGEAGLRERYHREIQRFAPPDRDRLAAALELAARLHREDRRVREPYVNHLLRVAIRIMHHYEVSDVDVIAAAVLHDTVEDHPGELAGDPGATSGQAVAALAGTFGDRVAGLVAAVTNPEYDPSYDKHEQYREHVRASLDREPWARVIKVSDFTDNGVGVIHTTGPKVERLATKYRPMVPVLRELVARPDTPLSRLVKQHIFRHLDLAEERFAAILDGR